jgi:hypothetical protein
MRRAQVLLLMAAASVGLLLIVVSMMAERGFSSAAPLVVVTQESSNNDSCDHADPIGLGIPVQGAISPVTDTDYFSVTIAQIGQPHIARASVGPADFNIRICVRTGDCTTEIDCSSPSSSYVEVEWDAFDNVHFVKVEKWGSALITHTTTSYVLEVVEKYVSPPTDTPTPSATPTETSTPTASPTLSPEDDDYEQNDDFNGAYTLPVATSVELSDLSGVANFYPVGDEDWFRFWAKNGKYYKATTSGLSGVDTYVEIRDQNNGVVESDDDGAGGLASRAEWQAAYDGYYYIRIINKVSTTGAYDLAVEESDSPDPTSTPTPGPGPDDEADSCEDNSKFERACIIAPNQAKTFNLVPLYPGGVDNDYYKIWIKPGYMYECFTSNLDPGIDPNMIVYDHNQNGIGGNDDDPRPEAEPGDLNSYFAYYATYEGWLYLLVGTGDRTPSDVYNSKYTLQCNMRVPGEATPTGTPATDTPTATPGPQTPTPTQAPAASPTATGELTVRPLTTPTPVPETTPGPQFVPIELLVYYDANDDHQPGAGEGIAGISAQAYEAATNQLLAQGFTGEQGDLEFTVAAQGPVRVSVPFFGFSQLVASEGASIYLRVPPQPLVGAAP